MKKKKKDGFIILFRQVIKGEIFTFLTLPISKTWGYGYIYLELKILS